MKAEFTKIFDYFNYSEPKFVEYHKNKVDIFVRDKSDLIKSADIEDHPNRAIEYAEGEVLLFINGRRWLRQYLPTTLSSGGIFSHYWLARGHTLTTGLGLGVRENWLLNKKEVTKLTVLEKNLKLIDYHKEHNPDLFERAEVIHVDANEYVGECDVLLMDHYEEEPLPEMAEMSSKVAKNINCEVCWFWPLEELLQRRQERVEEEETLETLVQSYEYIKKKYDLPKLPEANLELLTIFKTIFNVSLA